MLYIFCLLQKYLYISLSCISIHGEGVGGGDVVSGMLPCSASGVEIVAEVSMEVEGAICHHHPQSGKEQES